LCVASIAVFDHNAKEINEPRTLQFHCGLFLLLEC